MRRAAAESVPPLSASGPTSFASVASGGVLDVAFDLERRAASVAGPGAVVQERPQRQRRGGRQGGGQRVGPPGHETQRERSVVRPLQIDRQVAQGPPRQCQPLRAEVDREPRARGVAVGGDR